MIDELQSTHFFVKSLPVSTQYFEHLNEKFEDKGIDYTDITNIPELELFQIFNTQNQRILFTLSYLQCDLYQDFGGPGQYMERKDLPCF
jgi:hypothetical protein